jgi:alpha,alpha-trehalase
MEYLPRLRKEYTYWMDGADDLRAGDAHRHCVRLEDGCLLNRYWDDRDTPREESYLEDVTTAKQSSRPVHEVYRELRAGAASGWDFGARWCDEASSLSSIRTTAILPVDLNAMLYKLERQIGLLSHANGQPDQAREFQKKARARRTAIDRILWNDKAGAYLDYDWRRQAPRTALNAATVTPLYMDIATRAQARGVGEAVRARLLQDGGIGTSENISGQQWDQPNGWAPLQWLAIGGLRHYGDPLADEIAQRWLRTVGSLYKRESKLVEKYVVMKQDDGAVGGGGGEYPLPDGFGWTNGVTRRLLHEDPAHDANRAKAASHA